MLKLLIEKIVKIRGWKSSSSTKVHPADQTLSQAKAQPSPSVLGEKIDFFASLSRIVHSLLKYKPQMDTSLKKVIAYTEKSATDIGNSIMKIHATAESQLKDSIEIASQFDQNNQSASTLSKTLKNTSAYLYEAVEVMDDFVVSNSSVNSTLDNAKNAANKISLDAREINDLAINAKLLALNAKIEASKANQYGAGFSVVADEVGKLANQAKLLAENISEISGKMSSNISDIASKIENATNAATNKSKTIKSSIEQVVSITKNSEQDMKKLTDRALNSSRDISTSINSVIGYLQFQDLTRQEIEKAWARLENAWGENFKSETEFELQLNEVKDYLMASGSDVGGFDLRSQQTPESHESVSNQETNSKHNSTFGDVILFNDSPAEESSEKKPDAAAGDVLLF